jgi:hypothetical protein
MESTGDQSSSTELHLEVLISSLESKTTPSREFHFYSEFRKLGDALRATGGTPSSLIVAEIVAFAMQANDHHRLSSWDLYFGPLWSARSEDGEQSDWPSLSGVTLEMLDYWRQRASTSHHSVMKARYADLLWELPKKLKNAKPDGAMARIAIDAYLEGIEKQRYEDTSESIAKAARALDIALSLNDDQRVILARDRLLTLEDSVSEADPHGWGYCFDLFIDPGNKRIPMSDAQRDQLVAKMEARLTTQAAQPKNEFHPVGLEKAALTLAKYYRSVGRADDVKRVLNLYRDFVCGMRGIAPALIVSHALESLYTQLRAFGQFEEADSLSEIMRVVGEETTAEMKPISTEVKIPKEKVEEFLDAMLAGSSDDVLTKLAVYFVPKRKQLEPNLRKLAATAPLGYTIPRALTDEYGRTVARIGGIDDDFDGQLLQYMSQCLQLDGVWLEWVVSRGTSSRVISRELILAFLFKSPVFSERRRKTLEAGIDAFMRHDNIAALHILIPQIEQSLRELAIVIGAPVYTQRRGEIRLRVLDDLLRDQNIKKVFGDDVLTYFGVLFTDQRGWNLRNDVCHGLASYEVVESARAVTRVIHSLLVLALARHEDKSRIPETS